MTERYQSGKVYKLVNSVDDKIYVGSTCLTLTKRKACHKTACKTKKFPVYVHLKEIGFENVDIVLIESFPCTNKMELHKRERHWIDTLKPELNKIVPTRTHEEWIAENKEVVDAYQKQYYKQYNEQNKEQVNLRTKKYHEQHKEQIKAYDKQYRDEHKEQKKISNKLYREKQKLAKQQELEK
jgi:hypothetical protein